MKKRIKWIQFLVAATMLAEATAVDDVPIITTDPVAYLRANYDFEGVTKIYKLEADINNDGRKEVFLAPLEPEENGQELGWFLFIAKDNGKYLLAGETKHNGGAPNMLPGFSKKLYWIGNIPEIGRFGLLTLMVGTGGQAKCQLHAIVIEGDGWKDIPIGEPVNAETKYEELKSRFQIPPSPSLQELQP